MDDDVEQQIRAFAMGRVGLGVTLLVAPGTFLTTWLGREASTPVARMIARYVGGRDVALGVGTILALKHDAPVRGWLEAGSMSDATDFVATVLALPHLPRRGLAAAAALSGLAGAAWGRQLVGRLQT